MNPLRSRLARYLAVQILFGIFVAAGVVTTIILLVDFVEQSRAVGTRVDVSAFDLLILTLMRAPLLVEETLPFIFLFGVLFALFRLNRRSELIVMRASGYSAWRIVSPAVIIALVFGVLAATLLNPIGSALNAQFEARRDMLTQVQAAMPQAQTVWLRETTNDGFIVINARQLEENARELDAPVFHFYTTSETGRPELDRRISASSAQLTAGFWTLEEAVERTPGAEPVEIGAVSLPTSIDRQSLFERIRSPRGVSFWDLPGLIASAEASGLAAERFVLRWQGLLTLPLTLIAASLIAAAATLRLYRLGGAAAFALTGGAAGFLVYFVQEVLRTLGENGTLPPLTAAWAAPLITTLLALAYIASTEDG
ncbi:LptF/LptG family permease [Hyphobacterium sp. CCMP332]|uniref:LptF/LptG family permease n=1 Tax=Hyphobacterium sp. CCMP332 TaxID=2749086 RepID=UPI00164F688A|nr:LptF/LptG family permease [Hyphobacterium sp. CCMP332]QNL18545.1 LptF/LptG family permease [Hyphobacterium sp. CCMP332]